MPLNLPLTACYGVICAASREQPAQDLERGCASYAGLPCRRSWVRVPSSASLVCAFPKLSADENKDLVRRLVREAVAERNLEILDELAGGEFAELAKRWVRPFESAFPDFTMEIVELVADDDKVVAHFKCSGTHRGEWLGHAATGRRFEDVDEIYIFQVRDGKLIAAMGVEDNLSRLRQLKLLP